MVKIFAPPLCLVLTFILSGCGSLAPSVEPQAHELIPTPSLKSNARSTHQSLYLPAVRAQGPYASQRIAYRKQPLQLSYYVNNIWAAPPAELLAPWLQLTLEASGLFDAVVSGAGAPLTRYRLDTELVVLRHEFEADNSQVRLIVRVVLVDLDERVVIDTKRFEMTKAAASEDAYGGVIATNELVTKLLEEIADFCVSALGSS